MLPEGRPGLAISKGRADRVLFGIFAMIASVALFSIVNVLVKHLGTRYSVAQLMFFRSALALLPTLGLVSFTAFRHLPAADVVAINFAAPLFVTALSVSLLGEPVGWRRWTAVTIGFVGVLVMVQPARLRPPSAP